MHQIDRKILKRLAAKYIWWKAPDEALLYPERVVAQVMNIGDYDDVQMLAESTQRLSDNFKSQHPEIEWYKIAGLRDILVHDYLGIDLETVWAVAASRLPELKTVVRDVPFS